jgi:hypothetical protein
MPSTFTHTIDAFQSRPVLLRVEAPPSYTSTMNKIGGVRMFATVFFPLSFWSICLVNLSLEKSTEGSSSCGAAFCIVALTFPVALASSCLISRCSSTGNDVRQHIIWATLKEPHHDLHKLMERLFRLIRNLLHTSQISKGYTQWVNTTILLLIDQDIIK